MPDSRRQAIAEHMWKYVLSPINEELVMDIRLVRYATIAMVVGMAGGASATEATYSCDGGTRLKAVFSSPGASPAQVTLSISGASAIVLPQVMSADGGRYANQDVEFWIKGNSATFTHNGKVETCQA